MSYIQAGIFLTLCFLFELERLVAKNSTSVVYQTYLLFKNTCTGAGTQILSGS